MTGLYIHIPWCIKKCPYCDFNSHKSPTELPETAYIQALIRDFKQDLVRFGQRDITSVFIGGGTPSLLSSHSYHVLFQHLRDLAPFAPGLEITLEANPGTFDQARFEGYRQAGINRLSLGIQSFQPETLKHLGRVHQAEEAYHAIQRAKAIGFDNINLDLMYGAPHQTPAQSTEDLQIAIDLNPTHLSWYQFTLEPNTYFYRYPPPLPQEEALHAMESQGLALLHQKGYHRYEISAYQRDHHPCQHNLNYWLFGDYIGIGAGAHGKLTDPATGLVTRTQKHRMPAAYLNPQTSFLVDTVVLSEADKLFEFMLNTTRLEQSIPFHYFVSATGLPLERLMPLLTQAAQKDLVVLSHEGWQVPPFGRQYTNELQLLFIEQ